MNQQSDHVMPRDQLLIFATLMEEKLRIHDDDRGEVGWRHQSCSVSRLFTALRREVDELERALNDCNPECAQAECADVANFAMMIADRIAQHRAEQA